MTTGHSLPLGQAYVRSGSIATSRSPRLLALILLLTLFSAMLQAQLPVASLGGTVTDPQGAVFPGAKVTITNQGTGVSRDDTSGADGQYLFTNLPPGNYTVRVEGKGVATKEFKNVKLEVGHAETLSARLQLARAGEAVTVTGG